MKPFKILSREKVLWEKFYKVEKQIVELPNGDTGEWYIKVNNDAVILVPMTENGEVLMQHNYKHGCGEIITEFCAGLIDDGENWEEAAARELSEETGYEGSEYIKIGEVFASPTSCGMKYHLVLVKNVKKVREPHLEPEEQVETFLVKNIEEASEILHTPDHLTSSGVMTALEMALQYFEKHR